MTTYYSAQSYLRYQGQKFITRFDANCYIAITRKLDTHDVSRNRVDADQHASSPEEALIAALIQQPTLILGIQSDGLFTFAEQQELAASIPNAELKTIDSPEGHDAFLLEFEQVNRHVLTFLNKNLPDVMSRTPVEVGETIASDGTLVATKTSTFGEVEVEEAQPEVEDITNW